METKATAARRQPWNKRKIIGQEAPFKLEDIWALRVRLQMENRVRELALFNLGIESKLRGCDLVSIRVRDICHGEQVASLLYELARPRPLGLHRMPSIAIITGASVGIGRAARAADIVAPPLLAPLCRQIL